MNGIEEVQPAGTVRVVDADRLSDKIARARANLAPLHMLIIATKPCYVKLSPLVVEARRQGSPMVIVDTGHHFSAELTGAGRDFGIGSDVDVFLDVRGSMLGRTADLATRCEDLAETLRGFGADLRTVMPVVSGDTSTSATFPLFWYLETGARCVHIEAGLRSRSPFRSEDVEFADVVGQRVADWALAPDDPFPEGVDTRVTSVVAGRLLAPLPVNRTELLREGYDDEDILVTGSLSADAVEAVCGGKRATTDSEARSYRIDVHRRENMTVSRLDAIVTAAEELATNGNEVSFVMTNQIRMAFDRHQECGFRHRLDAAGVRCEAITPSYVDFLRSVASGRYGALLTDSGGLQEELAILGVPCCILRFSTDRPETVVDFGSAVLAPPVDGRLILKTLEWFLSLPARPIDAPYGSAVSKTILADLGRSFGPRSISSPVRERSLA